MVHPRREQRRRHVLRMVRQLVRLWPGHHRHEQRPGPEVGGKRRHRRQGQNEDRRTPRAARGLTTEA